ncbi:beta-carotene hydroxylase [Fulvitalea axinellae]|uniref:Beta-carotene hydroxylase n=1 Tax=Fulvitalea axinellae TaxID=1182444 RepID=A0AAU9CN82_9BACT|nr:beta-carotene hydroxylase [Fulvitalea axinellae]
MDILTKIGVTVLTFLFMEFVAWFTHKYIMHGFLWTWHRSHHRVRKGFFERNDLFFIVFSVPAVLAFYFGFTGNETLNVWFFVGLGVTGYGIFYLLFHDILVHQRVKFRFKAKSAYLKRMINAHYAHHSKHTKDGCEAFGFLWAPEKYRVKEKKKTVKEV